MYRPSEAVQMTTAMVLQIPTPTKEIGVTVKSYTDVMRFNCNFKTYGGTESVSNNVLSVIDTADITCWYNPMFASGCRVKRLNDNAVFEILGEPENLEMRNMYLKFKIRRIKGGA